MKLVQHRWVRHTNLNSHGNLFGGDLLSWIDEEASMCAHNCFLEKQKLTTVGISHVSFNCPSKLGDRLRLEYEPIYIGHSSIIIKCEVNRVSDNKNIAEAYVTMCGVDDQGLAVQIKVENLKEIEIDSKYSTIANLLKTQRVELRNEINSLVQRSL